MDHTAAKELLLFIKQSPTCFHAIDHMSKILKQEGYQELNEAESWKLKPGGKYYVIRNQSSIIALHVGTDLDHYSFNIAASHSDSPTFQVKENAQLEVRGKYTQLNTEGYGGMLCASWFDRPLSLAGRVMVKEGNTFTSRLVMLDRDVVLIPNLAIHMNRSVNDGYAYNKQIDLLPLFGGSTTKKNAYKQLIADELGVSLADIYGMDIYLYNRVHPSIWGANEEFISSARLDNLESAYTSLQGFIKGYHPQSVNVFACFNNEEVGSLTQQGAGSSFLSDTLRRLNASLGKTEECYHRALASGFMLSIDNAHAMHPNHPEKSDVNHCVYMNEGIVIKSNANQKYTSDAVSVALFKEICERIHVPVQFFVNRSDMLGGSTLGNIAQSHVACNCVDIGLAQLAMHSSYETAGAYDVNRMIQALIEFYSTHFHQIDATHIEMMRD